MTLLTQGFEERTMTNPVASTNSLAINFPSSFYALGTNDHQAGGLTGFVVQGYGPSAAGSLPPKRREDLDLQGFSMTTVEEAMLLRSRRLLAGISAAGPLPSTPASLASLSQRGGTGADRTPRTAGASEHLHRRRPPPVREDLSPAGGQQMLESKEAAHPSTLPRQDSEIERGRARIREKADLEHMCRRRGWHGQEQVINAIYGPLAPERQWMLEEYNRWVREAAVKMQNMYRMHKCKLERRNIQMVARQAAQARMQKEKSRQRNWKLWYGINKGKGILLDRANLAAVKIQKVQRGSALRASLGFPRRSKLEERRS